MVQNGQQKDPLRGTRIAYVAEASFEYFITFFVTTNFLVYILNDFGVPDGWKGIISSIATFSCVAQLFAVFSIGRRVKRLATVGHLINQLCFTALYLLPPLSLPPVVKTTAFLVLLVIGHLISSAITPIKINWLMKSVPDGQRGTFTAVKEIVSLLGGMGVSMALGAVADHFRLAGDMPGYYRTCCIALIVLTVLHTASLIVAKEPESGDTAAHERIPVLRTVRNIFTCPPVLKVIGVGVLWSIASSLSVAFFASYLQQELAFTMLWITVMGAISSVCRILVSPLLGRIADRRSFAFCMTLCFGIAALAFFVGGLVSPGKFRFFYPVYLCLHSMSMGGINSGALNLIFDYVPPRERAATLGVKNAVSGVIGFLTSLFAGFLLMRIQRNGGFRIFGFTLYAQQVLSFLSFFVVLLLVFYTRFVITPMKRTGIGQK